MEKPLQLTGIKSILHALFGLTAFLVIVIVGSIVRALLPLEIAATVAAVFEIGLTFLVLSLYCKKVLGIDLKELRVRKPHSMSIWIICAFALPLVLTLFFISFTNGSFAISELTAAQTAYIIISGVIYSSIKAAIVEELIFRSLMMKVLEVRWGKVVAILIPSIIFPLLHIPMMASFNFADVVMLTIAGTCVRVMFSMIVYQSGSIWPAVVVHVVYNIWSRLIMGYPGGDNLIAYVFESDSILITGGAYGQSASIPTTIGYIVIASIAFALYKKQL